MSLEQPPRMDVAAPEAFLNREMSWLAFARRVLAQVADPELPLLERVRFAGIMGTLHDEFFMKRMSHLKRLMAAGADPSVDGRTPAEQFRAARAEVQEQIGILSRLLQDDLRPAMERAGVPIKDVKDLSPEMRRTLRTYFRESVLPILTPLAVDAEHPFPFISHGGINLALLLPDRDRKRFVRIKVPPNRPRWVPLPNADGFVPLEQVMVDNLDLMFPGVQGEEIHLFRVTRDVEGEADHDDEDTDTDPLADPGSLVDDVSSEVRARHFADAVRLQVEPRIPEQLVRWLCRQLEVGENDVYPTEYFFRLSDLTGLEIPDRPDLRLPIHKPRKHRRLRRLDRNDPDDFFDEIRRGDILLHHPYDDFDSSVLRFLDNAARDPAVLAIKLTVYRTSSDSPILRALVKAARRRKQVAVLVEITARFDEAPNIAWGQRLESEGVHVSYGVERLKTHVKLALVVREEAGRIRHYAHIGTGNYHSGTARHYEDLGLLTADKNLTSDVADLFNALTSATPHSRYRRLLVAPQFLRARFTQLIQREAENAAKGLASGIHAKMNQLEDPAIIQELYKASQAGVPVKLIVRGLCALRPGVPGLSETIQVTSVVGRFLEHSRIYRFENNGEPVMFIGSADWMTRNLDHRVESVAPILDPKLQGEIDRLLKVYADDNVTAWDCGEDGTYTKREPAEGEERKGTQETFMGGDR